MYGNWLRVTPAEVERAMNNPQWGAVVTWGEGRRFESDKTWRALGYLLERQGFPVDLVFGERWLLDGYDPETSEPDPDWGYGPPGILNPEEVRLAAPALSPLTAEGLVDGADPADGWASEELKWAVELLPDIKEYFGAAAKSGDAVLCWIE